MRGSSSKWIISSLKYLSISLTELLGFLFFEPAAIKPNNLGKKFIFIFNLFCRMAGYP